MKTSHLFLIGFATLSLTACQTFDGFKQDLNTAGSAISSKVGSLNTADTNTDSETEARTAATTATNADSSSTNKAKVVVNNNACPPIYVDPQLSHASEFYNPEKPSQGTEVSSLDLTDTASECHVADGYKEVKIQLSFKGALGPKAKRKDNDRPFFAYPYFVSVADKEGEELAKELFAASVTYETKQDSIELYETIRQRLPLNDDGSDPGYQIKIGFQLTEDQLFYNASR